MYVSPRWTPVERHRVRTLAASPESSPTSFPRSLGTCASFNVNLSADDDEMVQSPVDRVEPGAPSEPMTDTVEYPRDP